MRAVENALYMCTVNNGLCYRQVHIDAFCLKTLSSRSGEMGGINGGMKEMQMYQEVVSQKLQICQD